MRLPRYHQHNPKGVLLQMTERLYDVWMLIVEYLPAHQVRRLYSVNKALFNIALDVESYPTSLFTTYGPSS